MNKSSHFSCIVVCAFVSFSCLSVAAAADGFVSLFNGKNFDHWKVPEGDNGHWKIIDGVIDYDAQSEAKGDKNLWSEKEYGDFTLRADWRIKETPYINERVPHRARRRNSQKGR